jgi:hypothetical protein
MLRDRGVVTALGVIAACGLPACAYAADMPVKAPPVAAAAYADGFYIWLDGSYQSVRLPTFDLGWRTISPALVVINGGTAFESYDPRATGAGVAGAVGYVFRDGTFPAAFGSNVRLELGASYIHALVTQSAASPTPQGGYIVTLDGLNPAAVGGGMTSSSTLSTDFAAWQVNLKAAGDLKFGTTTVTPSLAAFAGNTRNRQNFLQSIAGPVFTPATYQADARTRWTDFGARLGLDTKFEITPWAALGLGGYVGLAGRHASLSASDVSTLQSPAPGGGTIVNTSAIAADADTTPFLANAEASLTLTPRPRVTLRGFVGLNYDSRVPGIAAPFLNGPCCAGGTPAGIKFQQETSYYAGGGVAVKFAP